jgi:hypothetical protein
LQQAYLQQQGGDASAITAEQATAAMDGFLRSHCIDPKHLRANTFDLFYEQRRLELLGLISRVIGKTIRVEQPPLNAEDALEQVDEEMEEVPA